MNTGRVFTSGFQGRLASDNRKSRESSCFSNSLKVKRVGNFKKSSWRALRQNLRTQQDRVVIKQPQQRERSFLKRRFYWRPWNCSLHCQGCSSTDDEKPKKKATNLQKNDSNKNARQKPKGKKTLVCTIFTTLTCFNCSLCAYTCVCLYRVSWSFLIIIQVICSLVAYHQ